MYKSYTK